MWPNSICGSGELNLDFFDGKPRGTRGPATFSNHLRALGPCSDIRHPGAREFQYHVDGHEVTKVSRLTPRLVEDRRTR